MKKILFIFIFFHSALNGQFFHEQAYSFANISVGSFNKILPYNNGTNLVIGNFDGKAYAATLFEDGQLSFFNPFTLTKGDITFTDIIKTSTEEYVIGGICDNCDLMQGASKGFLIKLSNDLKFYSQLQWISSVIDANVYGSVLLMEKDSAIYSTYSGSLNGFGTRAHISKHNLSDLSLIWKKQYNESFFSSPTTIDKTGDDIVIATAGFDANVILKVNSDGDLSSLKKYRQGNSNACMLSNGDILLTVALPNMQRLYLIDKNTEVKDSFSINTGITISKKMVIKQYEGKRILITYGTFISNEIPYLRYRDNIDLFDINDKINFLTSIHVPENGTGNRNFSGSLVSTDTKLYLVGNRTDGKERPFYMVVSNTEVKPKPSSTFYNSSVCMDNELIIDRVQKTAPATLPHIKNNIVYANKINFKGQNENLWLDVYRPYDHYANGSKDKRPAFIFVPGGGYAFTSEDAHTILLQGAERGMIAIGVKYRVGIHPNYSGNIDSATYYAPYFLKASYRAQQDLRDAIAFIIEHADEYNIDKENIFLAGHSAGGNMVMNYAHVNQSDYDQSIVSDLGELRPAINVKGIIPWAAPFNVLDFQSSDPRQYIDASEVTPMYFIHGTCDPLVYYYNGNFIDSSSTQTIGAYNVVCKRQVLKLPYTLHAIIGGEHELSNVEDEVFESMFTWIKNEVMCDSPVSNCLTTTYSIASACSNISICPDCKPSVTNEIAERPIFIYPTISNGIYHIANEGNFSVTIFNHMGIIMKVFIESPQQIDLVDLPSGSYFAFINDGAKK